MKKITLGLCLFRCEIFHYEKMFSMKMYFLHNYRFLRLAWKFFSEKLSSTVAECCFLHVGIPELVKFSSRGAKFKNDLEEGQVTLP